MQTVEIPNYFTFSNNNSFNLIAGPCQIESLDHALMMGGKIKAICDKLEINFVYKSSFDKANRTSASSKRGIGLDKGIEILAEVGKTFNCPTITDIHESYQAKIVAEKVDILQIPAFLCRQTDLLKAAAETGKTVMVKKGQFLSPSDMKNVADKLVNFGCDKIMLSDLGTSFGYNTLITDFRGLPKMKETGWPVIFDATHSVQQPGGLGGTSGGERQYVETLARAAAITGVAGIFIETHENPDAAPSDGTNMLPIDTLEEVLYKLKLIDTLAKGWI